MRINDLLADLLDRSCAEVLGRESTRTADLPRHTVANGYVGVVGFSGRTQRGHVGIALASVAARSFHPLEEGQHDPLLSDYVGELANLLLGRVKAGYSRYGVDVHAGTPVVLRGVDLSVHSTDDCRIHACRVETPHGTVHAWIDAQHPQGIELEVDPVPVGEAEAATGEMFIF